MKILIMSDTHGRYDLMRRAMEMHRDADTVIFLGDGLSDARACERLFDRPIWQVAGDCDSLAALWAGTPTEQGLILGGKRLLLTHGHRHGVKAGLDTLASYAVDNGYDIVLFGHTHERTETYISCLARPVYLFNPGSLGSPRRGEPSYGLLQIEGDNILFSHGELPSK